MTNWPWREPVSPEIYDRSVKWPKISIVTPSYNQGQFIEETVLSVINQNYPNLEYIIIDGGSTDSTVDIIKKHEKHITYWVSEPDKGQSHAINKGIGLITGDIFNWLNSDDYLEPKALFRIAQAFRDKPLLVTGRSRILNPDNSSYVKNGHNRGIFDPYSFPLSRFFQPSTYISTQIISDLGLLSETLHYVMDVEWYLKYLLYFGHENVIEIDDILTNFRLHESSKGVRSEGIFYQEINFLFYHLALNIGATKEAYFIDKYILTDDIKSLKYRFVFNPSYFNFRIAIRSIHNFIFEFITDIYVNGNLSAVKEALNFIDIGNLSDKNKVLYNTYSFRMNYMYTFLFTLRKIKSTMRKHNITAQ